MKPFLSFSLIKQVITIPSRTPIVTTNTSETLKTFNLISEELKSQYISDIFVPSEAILKLLEDPILVVDILVKAVTDEYVPMWLFPGIQANYFLRFVCLFCLIV